MIEMRFYEKRSIGAARLVTFVSPEDSSSFLRRHPRARVLTVPNGVDLDYFAPVAGQSPPSGRPPEIVFIGNFGHLPNEAAAAYLVRQVAPLVWARCPEARFVVVGGGGSSKMPALAGPRVELTGRVEDVRTYLARASVVALPMISGTGIKNKLLEAWASSRAVVATPLACQGVPARDGENLFLADRPKGLADRICRLLGDGLLRDRIAAAGRRCVEGGYSWSTVTAPLRREVCRLRFGEG